MDHADQMDPRRLIDGRQGCMPEPNEISRGSKSTQCPKNCALTTPDMHRLTLRGSPLTYKTRRGHKTVWGTRLALKGFVCDAERGSTPWGRRPGRRGHMTG